jgi:gamma-glutamyltranspeptidase/glutathione hydrolase
VSRRGGRPGPVAQRLPRALGRRTAVAASHPAISAEGHRVLATGGNAVDATLAMAAVAWMVLPGQCGVGGDAMAIVREPDGRVWTVVGSGFGPDGGTPDFYRDRGHGALPLTGPLSVAVPGAPAALRLLERHATLPLPDLWATGIRLARDGVPATAKQRADVTERLEPILADPEMAAVFAPDGRPPELGQLIRQPGLADSLATLADDLSAFYRGDFADLAVATLRAGGAPFEGSEWAATAELAEEPAISVGYGGGRLHQTPVPSPGWMMLHQAAVLDGMLAGGELLDGRALTAFADAARLAFDHRYEACSADNDGWRQALVPVRTERERRLLRSGVDVARPLRGARIDGDTTSTVCVDREGRAVAFIHSLAFTFGARITVPGTGVVLNNRLGRGAYLVPGHPNEVHPRRKPLNTLNAWVLDSVDDGLLHVGSCPGGDGQVQWNMQVLSHLVDHGLDPQAAVALPRLTVWPGSDADVVGAAHEVRVEAGMTPEALAELARSHVVVETEVQRGGPGGSAMAISRNPATGVLAAGADPRMDGVALAG